MNLGTENRRKTIIAGSLGAIALVSFGWLVYTNFFQGGTAPPTPPPSIIKNNAAATNAAINSPSGVPADATPAAAAAAKSAAANAAKPNAVLPTGNAAGVDAKQIAVAATSLDPTLDPTAMLRTESLVYAGSGRNIFSALYTPPVRIEKPVKAVRLPPPPPPVPCPPNCPPPPPPPPPPPIPLKFFGTETKADGSRMAFLLNGEDVYIAGPGDIIVRRYKIKTVSPNAITVEDLGANNTQTLPLQTN